MLLRSVRDSVEKEMIVVDKRIVEKLSTSKAFTVSFSLNLIVIAPVGRQICKRNRVARRDT